jgi:beta-lactamase superfamily II metal-dependent hydrolase
MELYFLQAECGDAAHLVYTGNDGKVHDVLVDSGYERTYRHVLAEVMADAGPIDLFVVSHIHDDHIGGAISFTRAVERGEVKDKVRQWCYNPPRPRAVSSGSAANVSVAASIDQGDKLVAYLSKHGRLPAQDVVNTLPPLDLHGLTISWLSPSPRKLKRLRDKYADPSVALEKEEQAAVSSAAGASGNDYYLTVEGFDLKKWTQDGNVENGSSIAFLTEQEDFRVLWLADAHPRVIEKAIRAMGYTAQKRLRCDYVKVTHHGSKGNNSDGLYSLVDCCHYVISADGVNRHYLPSKESMARILRNPQREVRKDRYHFYFTYDNAVLRGIFDVDGAEVFDRWNFELHFIPLGKKWLKLPGQ